MHQFGLRIVLNHRPELLTTLLLHNVVSLISGPNRLIQLPTVCLSFLPHSMGLIILELVQMFELFADADILPDLFIVLHRRDLILYQLLLNLC